VADGEVRYYIAGGRGGGPGGVSGIATRVSAAYAAQTIGGYTVYDLGAS
jgi:hypothetical protein